MLALVAGNDITQSLTVIITLYIVKLILFRAALVWREGEGDVLL